jgi:hypothetical protein
MRTHRWAACRCSRRQQRLTRLAFILLLCCHIVHYPGVCARVNAREIWPCCVRFYVVVRFDLVTRLSRAGCRAALCRAQAAQAARAGQATAINSTACGFIWVWEPHRSAVFYVSSTAMKRPTTAANNGAGTQPQPSHVHELMLFDQLQINLFQRGLADDIVQNAELRGT